VFCEKKKEEEEEEEEEMESKSVIMSALGVGIGVGVGIGLASGQTVGKWTSGVPSSAGVTPSAMEQEMLALIVNGKDSKVTFDQFPYYLSEQTRVLLSSAAFVHLKKGDIIKHTRNLSPASRTILLSGPAELYQQMLAKALAHYFGAELLLLDVNDFSLKIQSKYGSSKETSFKRSISESTLGRMSELFGSFSMLQPKEENKGIRRQSSGVDLGSVGYEGLNPEKLRRNASASANINDLLAFPSASTPATSVQPKRESSWSFDEKLFIQTLYKVLAKESKMHPVILYLRDVEKLLSKSQRFYVMFQKMLKRLSGPILILGSRIIGPENDYNLVDEKISAVFPYNIEIKPPVDENHLVSWKSQLEDDMKMIQFQDNKNHIMEVLAANDLDCDDLGSLCFPDTNILSTNIEEIVVTPDNEFEKRIRPEVIPAKEIGVTFADIGALDDIKESLQELILLPLRRPDLFKGGLLKPCRGILLFGPPGTGKTMLAKAIANEAGASFINVSMSTITSKWFGEDEKNVRALFSVAAKVSPTIIFVDEVDSMLGQRNRAGEHEAMRKIKNEFMTHWDGLLSKPGERILVLAATNRPFDLDEAIIRRFERRQFVGIEIMVGLPSVENREKILRTLLSKEKVEEGLDFTELARMTEGYSGSDLKNLCITAAYRPVRELIKQESLKDKEKKQKGGKGEEGNEDGKSADKKERVITIRPLNMEDLKEAKNQVAASFAAEGSIMNELKQWNDSFGEGGSRKKEQLSYFL
ncbi:P-loop containing nucleoside triphosphatehydrolases superfamily protein, partial [Striga asiatica]